MKEHPPHPRLLILSANLLKLEACIENCIRENLLSFVDKAHTNTRATEVNLSVLLSYRSKSSLLVPACFLEA